MADMHVTAAEMCIRDRAHSCFLKEVTQKGENIRFVFLEHAAIDPVKIPDFIALYDYEMCIRDRSKTAISSK